MKMKLSLTLASMCLASAVSAVPTINPTTITRLSEIQNKTNSNVVSDNSDERIFWVMPPNSGSSQVKGLHSMSSNHGLCKEMSNLQNYSRDTSARIDAITDQEIESKKVLDDKNAELFQEKRNLVNLIDSKNLTELEYIETRIGTLETQIQHLTGKLSECGKKCREILSQITQLKTEKREEVSRRRDLVVKIGSVAKEYEKQKSVISALESEVAYLEGSWSKLRDSLASIRQTFINLYKDFGKMEGARASIHFDIKWDENVNALREGNPGFSFQIISTQNAVVMSSLVDIAGLPESGAIMRYSMDGTF